MYKVSNQMIATNFAVADAATNYCFYIDNVRVYFKPYTTYDMSANAGTTDTFGLDGLTASQVTSLALTFDRGVSVAENPVATGANTSNSVIKMSGEGGIVYPIFDTKMPQVIETMVVRSYVKFTNNGKQFTFYGATAENSLVGVAKTVDTTELPENVKASIEAIVAIEK